MKIKRLSILFLFLTIFIFGFNHGDSKSEYVDQREQAQKSLANTLNSLKEAAKSLTDLVKSPELKQVREKRALKAAETAKSSRSGYSSGGSSRSPYRSPYGGGGGGGYSRPYSSPYAGRSSPWGGGGGGYSPRSSYSPVSSPTSSSSSSTIPDKPKSTAPTMFGGGDDKKDEKKEGKDKDKTYLGGSPAPKGLISEQVKIAQDKQKELKEAIPELLKLGADHKKIIAKLPEINGFMKAINENLKNSSQEKQKEFKKNNIPDYEKLLKSLYSIATNYKDLKDLDDSSIGTIKEVYNEATSTITQHGTNEQQTSATAQKDKFRDVLVNEQKALKIVPSLLKEVADLNLPAKVPPPPLVTSAQKSAREKAQKKLTTLKTTFENFSKKIEKIKSMDMIVDATFQDFNTQIKQKISTVDAQLALFP